MAEQVSTTYTLVIGFSTGPLKNGTAQILLRETQDNEDSTELEWIKDESGADAVGVISNQGNRYSVEGHLLANLPATPRKGDTITMQRGTDAPVKGVVESCRIREVPGASRISLVYYVNSNLTLE